MNNKTDVSSAMKQYNELDPVSQQIAMTILQLVTTLFVGIQQVQSMNEQKKKDA